MGELVRAGDVELWVEQRGEGPEVLLIAGLGDVAEAWEAQLEGLSADYRVTAFDNRDVGRSTITREPFTVATMADDAAALLAALGIESAHVAGFSMGGAIAQELALRHPEVVRTLVLHGTYSRSDAYMRSMWRYFRAWPEVAPSERAFFEAFFLWVYTARAHSDGSVDAIIDEVLAFPHPTSLDALQRTIDALLAYEDADDLSGITVPTLVLAGELDLVYPPRYGRVVADGIPDARFEILPGEAHQPFQEVPDAFNARVDAFWRQVDRTSVDRHATAVTA